MRLSIAVTPETSQNAGGSEPPRNRTTYWTSEMIRVLLDCVDDAAGDDSIFVADLPAAVEGVLAALRPIANSNAKSRLNSDSIWKKIYTQAKYGGSDTTTLLRHGTKCLDLAKLPKGVYTEKEIQDSNRRQRSRGKSPSANTTPQDTRKKRPTADHENNTVKSTRSRATETNKDHHVNKKTKSFHKARDPDVPDTPRASRARSGKIKNPVIYEEVSDSQNEADDASDVYDLETDLQKPQRKGAISLAVPRPSESVYVCEVCDVQFHAKDVLIGHKLTHESVLPSTRMSKSSFQISLDGNEAQSTREENNILELVSLVARGQHLDVDNIDSEMKEIQANIFDATKLFLSDMKIDGNADVKLQFHSYEESLIELLCIVFGSGRVDNSMQFDYPSVHLGPVKRRELVLAIIGSAVTKWALRPLPQGELGDGVLGEMNKLLRARSPVFQDTIMGMAVRQHLENNVKPSVPRYAQVFAHDTFKILCHFLTTDSQYQVSPHISDNHSQHVDDASKDTMVIVGLPMQETSSSSRDSSLSTHEFSDADSWKSVDGSTKAAAVDGVPSNINFDFEYGNQDGSPSFSLLTSSQPPSSPSPQKNESLKWPPAPQKEPTQMFLTSLREIYESALNLRLDMEIRGNAKYEFKFPISGTTPDLEQQAIRNRENNKKFELPDSLDPKTFVESNSIRVMTGLTPAVSGKFREGDRSREWRKDMVMISKGSIHVRCDQSGK